MSVTQYRKGAAGLSIRYALAESGLGWLIVGATERGVCAIEFGKSPARLVQMLTDRFPRADLEPDVTNDWLVQVLELIKSPHKTLDLPLEIQGTAFQQQVWRALQTIPSGETRSYTEVAELVGRPAAVRAVAQACALNPVAVAIPCHRVVRRDGELSGYRWGIDRKKKLLGREKQASTHVLHLYSQQFKPSRTGLRKALTVDHQVDKARISEGIENEFCRLKQRDVLLAQVTG